jgi:pimeloyl-ACP methyl ester carboxylesterase
VPHEILGSGVAVHVWAEGPSERPPLLLVHGFLGSAHWFDRLTPLLAGPFRVIRTDLLGHGRSGTAPDGYAPQDQARALAEVLGRLGITSVAVLGHSLGADVAIALAELGAPVSALMVVNEGPDYTLATTPAVNSLLRLPGIGRFLYARLPASAIRSAVARFFAPGFAMTEAFSDPDWPVLDARAVGYECFRATQDGKEQYVADVPLDIRLGRLSVPAFVLFGQQDQTYRSAESCARYRAVSGVRVETIAEAGHSPAIEAPERVASAVRRFLAE